MKQRTFLLTVAVLTLSCTVLASDASKHSNLDKAGVALKGYDPVSYFVGDKPLKGDSKITATHDGAAYRFASEDNRAKFIAEPAKYLPEYGGWCAKAIADKQKVDIDPLNYKITNGRLFLFYKGLLGDALKIWNKDESNLTRRADEQWKQIVAE